LTTYFNYVQAEISQLYAYYIRYYPFVGGVFLLEILKTFPPMPHLPYDATPLLRAHRIRQKGLDTALSVPKSLPHPAKTRDVAITTIAISNSLRALKNLLRFTSSEPLEHPKTPLVKAFMCQTGIVQRPSKEVKGQRPAISMIGSLSADADF